jgi:hypothetical protein
MAIGKKSKKGERIKALPDRFENEGPIELPEAYEKLSHVAFAVWIRLSVASREDLHGGRQYIADILGYSQRRSNEILLELERKGFIIFMPEGPWQKTAIAIMRKPLLRRGANFTKFSGFLSKVDFTINRSPENFDLRAKIHTVIVGTGQYKSIPESSDFFDHSRTCTDPSHTCTNSSHTCTNSSHTCLAKKTNPINLCRLKKEKK